MMILCGIDPGVLGALCFLSDELTTIDMPILRVMRADKNRSEIDAHALAQIFWQQHAGHAFLEQAWPRPNSGGVKAAYGLGRAYGTILGVLAAVGVPYTVVAPQTWKRALSVPKAKDGARARASELLPGAADQWRLIKHDGRAEAALIALWGRQQLTAISSRQT